MMKHKAGFVLWPLVALGVGGVSFLLSRRGLETVYPLLQKSALTPPNFVFPLVWTALYLLMGIGLALVRGKGRSGGGAALPLWLAQLGANGLWSPLFFRWQQFGLALADLGLLWLLVLAMVVAFGQKSRAAARLQLPYLVWITFAGYLNFVVWRLN